MEKRGFTLCQTTGPHLENEAETPYHAWVAAGFGVKQDRNGIEEDPLSVVSQILLAVLAFAL